MYSKVLRKGIKMTAFVCPYMEDVITDDLVTAIAYYQHTSDRISSKNTLNGVVLGLKKHEIIMGHHPGQGHRRELQPRSDSVQRLVQARCFAQHKDIRAS